MTTLTADCGAPMAGTALSIGLDSILARRTSATSATTSSPKLKGAWQSEGGAACSSAARSAPGGRK